MFNNRVPELYDITQINGWNSKINIYGNIWVDARPEGYIGMKLFKRLTLAYAVFIGKYDVLKWIETK